MARFILKRILLVLPVLAGLLVLTFIMIRIVPTDPAAALAGENASAEQVQMIRKQYGFDRPLTVQFWIYVKQVLTGDLGTSFYTMRPVGQEVLERLPATLELTAVSILLATVSGIPLGVLGAVRHNRMVDQVLRVFSVAGLAIATFWLALMLQLLFSMKLDILPLQGRLGIADTPPPTITGFYLVDSLLAGDLHTFASAVRHLTLPTLTLALGSMASIVRLTRSGVRETLPKDFVAYETAVGYPRSVLIGIYVLRNSLVAPVTQIGLLFGGAVANAVVIEWIFDWPGVGGYLVKSIFVSDYQATLAATLLIGLIYAVVNIAVDTVHAFLDPRVAEQTA